MRTYGRVKNAETGQLEWVVVQTDPATGDNSAVYLTALCQVLQGVRGESPFWSNYGIPAVLAVVQQQFPDFYVALTQQQFAPYFASLVISRLPGSSPVYQVSVVTFRGQQLSATIVPVPLPT